jgi:enolase-phosphatase E1
MKTKLFLFDIEGTTTDINFVHKVLFPYSTEHIKDFVLHHHNDNSIKVAVENVKETVKKEEGKEIDINGVVETLLKWIREDRKHGALKEIQGHIWDIGYSKNDFKGHVYPDVKPFFMNILRSGAHVGIYSSGSVHAQKLIFGYSCDGDLTPMISHYFDTKIGGKRERTSYTNIANAVHLSPADIHFFSDIPEELEAAKEAGLQVSHVLRPGTNPSSFEGIQDFMSLSRKLNDE